MSQHQVRIIIHRPVEDVFAFLTRPDSHSKWDPTSIAMEQEEPGPWQTGMTIHEVRRMGGRNVKVSSNIAVFEPNRRFEIHSLTGPDWHGEWVFERHPKGTQLTFTATMKMHGLARLAEPIIFGQIKPQIDANFRTLKTLLES